MESMVTTRTAGKLVGRTPRALLALIRDLNQEAAKNPGAPAVIYIRGSVDLKSLRNALEARARRETSQ